MAWGLPLGVRIGVLPTVLAGPILRAVTTTSVTVWVALKESASMTLTMHASDLGTAPRRGVARIGPHLYMVAVSATTTPLTRGTVYLHGLGFTTAREPKNLVGPPVRQTSPRSRVRRMGGRASYFRLATSSTRAARWTPLAPTRALLDDAIGSTASAPANRPRLVVLDGDQIYAEEVCDVLLMMLTDAGYTLLGPETLSPPSNSATKHPMPPSSRTKTIEDGN